MSKLRILAATDIAKCLDMATTIDLMAEAFRALSSGEALVPQRMHMEISDQSGHLLLMPAYIPGANSLGYKVVTEFANNAERSLPRIHALVVAFDAETGEPKALLDGEYLTALRTGAGSGLATRWLSREDSQTVAIFGAGVQARTQLEAVVTVREVKKTIVFGKSPGNVEKFCTEMSAKLNLPVVTGKSPSELLEADIICTATNSHQPVFSAEHVSQGTHINAVGAYQPHTLEIPIEVTAKAHVFVDQRAACMHEAGDLLIPIQLGKMSAAAIKGEIGEVVAASKPGRMGNKEITLYKSVGNAVQDVVCLNQLLLAAEEQDLGQIVSL